MKGGVECRDLRHAGHRLQEGIDAVDEGWLVQRCQGRVFPERCHHFVIDDDGAGELLPAVAHAVPHGVNLVQARNDARMVVHERAQHQTDGLHRGLHGLFKNNRLASCCLMPEDRRLRAYSVRMALGQRRFGCHIK